MWLKSGVKHFVPKPNETFSTTFYSFLAPNIFNNIPECVQKCNSFISLFEIIEAICIHSAWYNIHFKYFILTCGYGLGLDGLNVYECVCSGLNFLFMVVIYFLVFLFMLFCLQLFIQICTWMTKFVKPYLTLLFVFHLYFFVSFHSLWFCLIYIMNSWNRYVFYKCGLVGCFKISLIRPTWSTFIFFAQIKDCFPPFILV